MKESPVLTGGPTEDDIHQLLEKAIPYCVPAEAPPQNEKNALHSKLVTLVTKAPAMEPFVPVEDLWPKVPQLTNLMFHGLAGDIVRAIEPHTEADPVSLLVQILVAFGNAIGRNAHFLAEADQHFGNLYVVIVGKSSKGRKGSSWGHIKRLFARVCPPVGKRLRPDRAVFGGRVNLARSGRAGENGQKPRVLARWSQRLLTPVFPTSACSSWKTSMPQFCASRHGMETHCRPFCVMPGTEGDSRP